MKKPLTIDDVRVMLREQCDAVGGQSAWARYHDVSAQYVSDVLSRKRDPGVGVTTALGLVENERTWRFIIDKISGKA